jgi:hypothetical protein
MNKITIQNKSIYIFDNLLSHDFRSRAFAFLKKSMFRLGWVDTQTETGINRLQIYSNYSTEDLDNLGFFNEIKDENFLNLIKNYKVTRCMVNLSKPMDIYECHTHSNEMVVLYYANMEWKHEWAGETLFFNNDLSEIEYASIFKAGRVIVFDGEIPHTIRQPSLSAPNYRFTLSIFLQKE